MLFFTLSFDGLVLLEKLCIRKPQTRLLLLMYYLGCCCVKSLQSCPTLYDPMDCSPAGSSIHGIFQARMLGWVAMPSFRGSSRFRKWTDLDYADYGLVPWNTLCHNALWRQRTHYTSLNFSFSTCKMKITWLYVCLCVCAHVHIHTRHFVGEKQLLWISQIYLWLYPYFLIRKICYTV